MLSIMTPKNVKNIFLNYFLKKFLSKVLSQFFMAKDYSATPKETQKINYLCTCISAYSGSEKNFCCLGVAMLSSQMQWWRAKLRKV